MSFWGEPHPCDGIPSRVERADPKHETVRNLTETDSYTQRAREQIALRESSTHTHTHRVIH